MDTPIQWIGHSNRFYLGEPDTRFGWYCRKDNTAVIVKSLNPDAHVHAELVARHEAQMLREMNRLQLAAPSLIRHEGTSLHLEFAGLSLKQLTEQKPASLNPAELAQLFKHLCLRGADFAHAGMLHLDVWIANLVVPLEHGHQGGRLSLDRPIYIDCSNSLSRHMDLSRPLWISRKMSQIAPEVKKLLAADQDRMAAAFRLQGFEMRDMRYASADEFALLRELYRAYSVPQTLQLALRTGCLEIDPALQFALGVSLQQSLAAWSVSDDRTVNACRHIAERMTENKPSDRYRTLEEAAAAFDPFCLTTPTRSAHVFPGVCPEEIISSASQGTEPPTTCSASREPEADQVSVHTFETYSLDTFNQHQPPPLAHRRLVAGMSVTAFLAFAFIAGGYRGDSTIAAAQTQVATRQVQVLARMINAPSAHYAQALNDLHALASSKQPEVSTLAHRRLEDEANTLRSRLSAGLLRDSLPTRLLNGEPAAVTEWRELRPKLTAMIQIGYQDFQRWLEYCDQAEKPAKARIAFASRTR